VPAAMKEKRGLEAAAAAGDGGPDAKRPRPPALARFEPRGVFSTWSVVCIAV
jgi:hypothetical protein